AWQRRQAAGVCRREIDLARGPARLTVALGITGADDGVAVGQGAPAPGRGLQLQTPGTVPAARIRSGPRVGVSGAGGGQQYPWRFWIDDDPHVTAYRAAQARRSSR